MLSKLVRCNSCYFFVENAKSKYDDDFSDRCFANPPKVLEDEGGYSSVRPTVYCNDLGCSKYHLRSFRKEEC